MRHSALGPAIQTFGPNVRIAADLTLIGLLICGVAYSGANQAPDRTAWIIFDVLTFGFLVCIARPLVSCAWLHEGGISYRSIFGSGEVHWEDIEWIYYGVGELHAGHIALGKLEKLRIITREQETISFVGTIRDAGALYTVASQKTFERLSRRAVEEFNSGSELNFGAIRIEPKHGIILRKWAFSRRIPWQEISAFRVNDYFVRVHRVGRLFVVKVPAARVANVRVLQTLLTGVMK